MRPNRDGKRVPPGRGGYEFEVVDLTGEPVYHMPVPPAKYRGPLIPSGTDETRPEGVPHRPAPDPRRLPARLRSRTPLIPAADEIATLPRLAREAFLARCALRVKPITVSGIATPDDVARIIFQTATIDTPLTAQLRCMRRDFMRLRRLAREQKWTDETPVPPEVFGPMWPPGIEPYWAVESPVTPSPTPPTE